MLRSKKMHVKRVQLLLAAVAATAASRGFFTETAARGSTLYWGGATTGDWLSTTPYFWGDSNGIIGTALPTAADDVVFNFTGNNTAVTATASGNISANSITFNNTSTTSIQSSSTTARTLFIGAGGIAMDANAGAVTLSNTAPGNTLLIRLTGNQSWTNNSGATFNIINASSIAAVDNGGSKTLTLAGSGNFSLGSGVPIQTGAGNSLLNLVVNLSNGGRLSTFTNNFGNGGVSVLNGTYSTSSAGSVLGNSTLTLGDASGSGNATMIYGKAGPQLGDIIVQAGNTGNNTISTGTTGQIFSGKVSLNNALTLTGQSGSLTLAMNGNITGAGKIIVGTSVIASLNGTNNTYTGGTTLTAGIFRLTNGGNATQSSIGTGNLSFNGGTLDNTTASDIVLNTNNQIVFLGGSSTFTGTKNIDLGTGDVVVAAPSTLTTTAGVLTIGGNVTGNGLFNLTKAGAGGNLTFTHDVTLSAPGTITVSGGFEILNGIVISTNGVFDITKAGAGTLLYTPDLTVTGTPTATVTAGTELLSGTVTGFGSIIKAGAGTLELSQAYTLSGSNVFSNINAGTELFSGNLSGSGASVTMNSAGTLALSAADTYSGTTTLTLGTIKLIGQNGGAANSDFKVSGGTLGAVLNFDSSTSGVTGTTRANSVTLSGGVLTVNGNAGSNSNDVVTGAIGIDGNSTSSINYITVAPNAGKNAKLTAASISRTNGGILYVTGTNLGNTPGNGVANVLVGSGPTLIGGGGVAGSKNISIVPWAVGGNVTNSANSFVTYDSTNGFRPLDTVNEYQNALGVSPTDNVRILQTTASPITVTTNSDTTVNSLWLNSTGLGTLTLNGTGNVTVTSGAVQFQSNATVTLSNNINFGAAQGVIGYSRGKANTLNGNISGSGGLVLYQLTSAGNPPVQGSPGTGLAVNGTGNSYTGDTYLFGRLDLGNSNFLPSGARTGDFYADGLLNLNTSITINGLNGSGLITRTANGSPTLTLGDNNSTGTFGGTINNTGNVNAGFVTSITKIGAGTETFTGTNSAYNGVTTVNGGVLEAVSIVDGTAVAGTNNSSIGASANVATNLLISGGTLRYIGAATTTDRLFQVGQTTTNGNGTLDASGTGTIAFTNTGAIGYGTAGTTGVAQTRTLTLSGNNTGLNSLAAVIGNNGVAVNGNSATTLIKSGIGTWSITGNNTYTGGTTVSGGRLLVNNTAANSSGTGTGNVTVASGGLLGGNGTITGNITVQAGGTINAGNSVGVLTETGNLTVNGKLQAEVDQGTNTADRLNVFGAVNINGATLEFISTPAGPYVNPTPIVLIDNDSSDAIVGTFAGQTRDGNDSFTLSTGPVQYTLYYSYNSSDGNLTSGNDLAVSFQSVPEPTSLSFLGLGVGGLLTRRRRGKKAVR